jgi:hypothetical protein
VPPESLTFRIDGTVVAARGDETITGPLAHDTYACPSEAAALRHAVPAFLAIETKRHNTVKPVRKIVASILIGTLPLLGCATASRDVPTSYVSPMQYQAYDCDQIGAEEGRIQARVSQLGGRLDEAANNDKGVMAVGLIIFWPILFALGGTKQQEAEYGRLKGEYEGLQQAAIQKKCLVAMPAAVPVVTETVKPSNS